MHWNRTKIVDVLRHVTNIVLVTVGPQGSEITTEQLTYKVPGAHDRIYVRGFTTDSSHPLPQADDVDVEMIEVCTDYSDGEDSADPKVIIARAETVIALTKAGYTPVVRSLEPYF